MSPTHLKEIMPESKPGHTQYYFDLATHLSIPQAQDPIIHITDQITEQIHPSFVRSQMEPWSGGKN